MWRTVILASLALLTIAADAPAGEAPTANLVDPHSLERVIRFGSLPPSVGGKARGAVVWRADITLPRGTHLDRAQVIYSKTPVLRLRNGRCFKIAIEYNDWNYHPKGVKAEAMSCPDWPSETIAHDPPTKRRGLKFVTQAWDIDAYLDQHAHDIALFHTHRKTTEPLVRATMRLLALGVMACPDCGSTDIVMMGMIDHRLTVIGLEVNVDHS